MIPPINIGKELIGKTIKKVENNRDNPSKGYWEIVLTFTDGTYCLWRCNKEHKGENNE